MSVARAYSSATKLQAETALPVEQDATKVQAKLDWLSSTETERLFKDLLKQSDSLVTDAIGLALINHQSDNSKQIVHKLIEANTLRKVVEKYAR